MTMLSYIGPYGQFLSETHNTMINVISLSSGSNKVITPTGREYFIRPEDRANMAMYYYLRLAMTGGNLIGFGNKEAEQFIKTLDNVGRARALGGEETSIRGGGSGSAEGDSQFFGLSRTSTRRVDGLGSSS